MPIAAETGTPTLSGAPLFDSAEPKFGLATYVGEHRVYLFACSGSLDHAPCLVARAAREGIADRSAYQFFSGNPGEDVWSSDVNVAKPVFYANSSTLSATWND